MGKPNSFDPMLPIDSDKCRCTVCGLYLNSTYAFDRHRTGGKCLTVEQMRRKGWSLTDTGHWATRPRPAPKEPRHAAPLHHSA